MTDFMLDHEMVLRLCAFFGVLLAMIALESLLPRKKRALPRAQRWVTNMIMVVIDTLTVRLLFPVVAVGVAAFAHSRGWGLFNLTALPLWLEALLAFTVLDALIYAQHVASHKFPWLWALHKVHHSDRDIDVTTALRFHPGEIALSMAFKMLCVGLLGASVVSVVAFEIVLSATALFNHANLALPGPLDRMLRWVIVTPDMHRVHHSVIENETNSNFGFNFTIWDRLFGSYQAQPSLGHEGMTIGLAHYQDGSPARLGWSLALPFKR